MKVILIPHTSYIHQSTFFHAYLQLSYECTIFAGSVRVLGCLTELLNVAERIPELPTR